jgi:hypothetical protein
VEIIRKMKYNLADFNIHIQDTDLIICHGYKKLFSSNPSEPFLKTCSGKDDFTEGYGTFSIIDNDSKMTLQFTIDSVESTSSEVMIRGHLDSIQYSLVFYLISQNQLGFKISIESPEEDTKVFLNLQSTPDEYIYGCGEQLTLFNLKGSILNNLIGRSLGTDHGS